MISGICSGIYQTLTKPFTKLINKFRPWILRSQLLSHQIFCPRDVFFWDLFSVLALPPANMKMVFEGRAPAQLGKPIAKLGRIEDVKALADAVGSGNVTVISELD
jgi:hypothetical protein